MAISALAALQAHSAQAANFYLHVTGMPSYLQTNDSVDGGTIGGNTDGLQLNDQKGFSYQLHTTAGLMFWDNLLVGITYDINRSPKSVDAYFNGSTGYPSQTIVDSTTEWGPTLGFATGGLRLILTYYVSGSRTYTNYQADNTGVISDLYLKNNGGSGYRIELSYVFQLSTALGIGPSLVWRHLSYTRQDQVNNVTPSSNYTNQTFTTNPAFSRFDPMVSLVLKI